LASIDSSAYARLDPTLALNAANAAKESNNTMRSWTVFIVIAVIASLFIIVAAVYFFRGISATEPVPTDPVPTDPVPTGHVPTGPVPTASP